MTIGTRPSGGPLYIAMCVRWGGPVRFGNIRTLAGVTVNGEVDEASARVVVEAWKNTEFKFQSETVSMKRGERIEREVARPGLVLAAVR